ncbi:hypothetical protein Bpfe_013769 [Biomphalaria pfeifferi]|uniref:Uncharacterized protein n=1 Tax=Biomphalaria pfeifferi TaxID=112525 RepID=A0AAD8BLN7_BIOPF|nr:hypothetical protein Bpfe_013769 [Biomphalaria pfeifferi]
MNYSKKFTICMLVYLRLIQQTKGAKEPSISDLTELSRNCSNFCLPYGSCCTGFEFCPDGSCENCFPKTVGDEDLLNWCRDIGQHDSSQMRHRYSCIKACQNRFNAPDLMLCEADRSDSTKSNCSNKESRLCDSGHEFYHKGTCQACFPANIPETDLQTWCRDIGQHDSS